MTAPPQRRSFRFGLRTMFVVVTVACVTLGWLVWQIQIVRERKAVLAELKRLDADLDFQTLETCEAIRRPLYRPELSEYIRVPRVRRMLGDESFESISLPLKLDQQGIERAEKAFPEAMLSGQFGFPYEHNGNFNAFRDSLYIPRPLPNSGTVFKTGKIEK